LTNEAATAHRDGPIEGGSGAGGGASTPDPRRDTPEL